MDTKIGQKIKSTGSCARGKLKRKIWVLDHIDEKAQPMRKC